MGTATMNISLPDSLKEYVKGRVVDEERYSTPSDYVRSLIREDQQKIEDEERLEQMLLEGMRSGPGTTIRSKADWAKFWKKIDAEIQAKHNKHRP
jgi:putative addiction module CopG family antidote